MMQKRLWSFGFLLLAILIGPSLVLHIPPGHAPDERDHVLRADSLLHGQFIGHRVLRDAKQIEGVLADAALAQVITLPPVPLDRSPQPISPVQKWLATEVPWDLQPRFVESGSIAGYMPLLYLPGAAAIWLCRTAGLSPYVAFLAVRSINFYCFLLLGALALWWTRRGAVIIFVTLLLPMTLSLAASASQDGILIAGTACAVACLTRATPSADRAYPAWLACAAALLAVMAASKPPYAPLALLLLLPWRGNAIHLARRGGIVLLTIMPALAWTFLESRMASVAVKRLPAEAGPLWPGSRPAIFDGPDPMAQMQVLLAHKRLLVELPLQAIFFGAGGLMQQAIGVLDYLCLYLPAWLYATWYVGLACALAAHVCSGSSRGRQGGVDFFIAGAAILLSAMSVGLALYLDWTPVGMPWIGGIQGRYLLPLLPVVAFCLPRFARPRAAAVLAMPVIIAAVLSMVALPRIVLGFYPLQ